MSRLEISGEFLRSPLLLLSSLVVWHSLSTFLCVGAAALAESCPSTKKRGVRGEQGEGEKDEAFDASYKSVILETVLIRFHSASTVSI